MINLIIDGRAVQARPGRNLLEASLDAGIYIPHLCSHPDLPAEGGCKLCTVEVDGLRPSRAGVRGHRRRRAWSCGPRRLQSSKVRNVALELILAPHPKDCTSCRAYLNCELQALMQYTGVAHSRLREIDKETAPIGASDADRPQGDVPLHPVHALHPGLRRPARRRASCISTTPDGESVRRHQGRRPAGPDRLPVLQRVRRGVPDRHASWTPPACSPPTYRGAQALVPCQNNCPAHTDIPLYLAARRPGPLRRLGLGVPREAHVPAEPRLRVQPRVRVRLQARQDRLPDLDPRGQAVRGRERHRADLAATAHGSPPPPASASPSSAAARPVSPAPTTSHARPRA